MRLESWAASDIGLKRKSNQDSVGAFPEIGLFIVADGMGGRAGGARASRMAVEAIHEYIARHGSDLSAAVLKEAIEVVNEQLFEAGGGNAAEETPGAMGTTVVALGCAVQRAEVVWAHVGDSRLYRLRGGELALLTADHTRYGTPYLSASSVPADLPHTGTLLQALGTDDDVRVTLGSGPLVPGDVFLLCSDGVSGQVGADSLRLILSAATTLAEAGRELMRAALEAGGRDNASAAVVRVIGDS